ncbi:hypothetical protein Bpfe_021983 [Biomphalaria pfeifferi]|uniref:Uncharacterized protein n=1 Tax=Biomphalaria pfeifferi TaxID=112525 RepID=A0AAD8B898_BIOPF|nr:hypothetical protein Bpfe_021983 [Biomphalaria pfeifferi]
MVKPDKCYVIPLSSSLVPPRSRYKEDQGDPSSSSHIPVKGESLITRLKSQDGPVPTIGVSPHCGILITLLPAYPLNVNGLTTIQVEPQLTPPQKENLGQRR